MNRKILSGAQNRALASKRAKERENNKETLQELRWFYKTTNQNTDFLILFFNSGVENDPALWPLILKQKEKEIIKKSPSTLPDDFPRDASNNRAFPKEVLFIALPNGEKVQRNYSIWSPSSNSLLWFPCSLFGCENSGSNGDRSLLLRWNGGIRNDWRKLSDRIKSHHSNPVHRSHYLNWKTLHSALVNQHGIYSEFQKALGKEVARWREILRCILDATLFLASQNLSFRGQYLSMEKNEKGNFLSCLELIFRHKETLKNHLETVACHENKGTRMQAHYLS
ncbi:uncharacterized protein LOC136084943 [Hydra vulgaris]|uniref:Uncharacterized protein LOC136084943 n=1 Tax=Hydra vulgaris TaxID=6087 RepID=A0ABM4CKV9_HYDVU